MTIIRSNQAREKIRSQAEITASEKFEASGYQQAPAQDQFKMMTESEAAQIRNEAQNSADQILEQARTEAQQLKDQAQNEGREQGKNQGYQTVAQTITAAQNLIKQAEMERTRIVDSAKKEILALATAVATRIIHQELSTHSDLLMQIVADAILKISDRDQVIIRVNKEDLEFFKTNRDKIEDLLDGVKNLAIQADKHVGVGGLIIETKLGVVDARLETKMDVLQKALFSVYDQDAKMLAKQGLVPTPVVPDSALVEGPLPTPEEDLGVIPNDGGMSAQTESPEVNTASETNAPSADELNFDGDDLNLDDLDLDLEDK
jgi:flagellar assembly protein FliH